MTTLLPQIYREMAKELIPFTPDQSDKIGMITIDPPLPCFICNQPAGKALIAPAKEHSPAADAMAWLTFPICSNCEKRQVKRASPDKKE